MSKKLLILVLVLTNTSFVFAYMTPADYPNMIYDIYVDATVDNLWPTDDVNYTSVSDWSYGADVSTSGSTTKWYRKEGATTAINGTAFQGYGDVPQLTMTVTGLDASKTYNVYAVCWCRNDGSYWYTLAGLDGGPLWVCDNITEYDNIFCPTGTSVVSGCQLFLGQISGVTSTLVNVAAPTTTSSLNRAWFDGVALKETTPGPYVNLNISANITNTSSAAKKSLDGSVLDISPELSVGQNQIVQGTRLQVVAPQVGLNCPDIYDFNSISGDGTISGTSVKLKMNAAKSITLNYDVRVYTPVCGDLCNRKFKGDTNMDCTVNLEDLMNIVGNWLVCTKPECD